ncbi:MAG: hypothetical protein BYD32DRAFT_298719 [Podila humilis]|nr:MAG: hypothetical protein BYD32DRAFT_298719 [Podila humilis]
MCRYIFCSTCVVVYFSRVTNASQEPANPTLSTPHKMKMDPFESVRRIVVSPFFSLFIRSDPDASHIFFTLSARARKPPACNRNRKADMELRAQREGGVRLWRPDWTTYFMLLSVTGGALFVRLCSSIGCPLTHPRAGIHGQGIRHFGLTRPFAEIYANKTEMKRAKLA